MKVVKFMASVDEDKCIGDKLCQTVCPSGALTYQEEPKEVSLEAFLESAGNPNQRRARYAGVLAEPLRKERRRRFPANHGSLK